VEGHKRGIHVVLQYGVYLHAVISRMPGIREQ